MPLPAGTGMSRRLFLSGSLGLALSVYGVGKLLGAQAFEEGIAEAAAGPQKPVLLSIFADGGWDGLSLIAPTGDPKYSQLRPNLAISPSDGWAIPEDSRLRWNPAAGGFHTLYAEGKLSILPAIGYASPNQSHFTSRHFWEIGETFIGQRTGWLGRYLDQNGSSTNPLQGLSLDDWLHPSLATAGAPVAAVRRADEYDFWTPGVSDPVEERMFTAWQQMAQPDSSLPGVSQTHAATRQTTELRKQLQSFDEFTSPVTYPDNDLGGALASLAAMLAAGMPIQMVTAQAEGGYDTHDNQAEDFPNGVTATADAVLAFWRDLEARGLDDRVMIEIWSEFGRRPEENSSGTDHGAGGVALLIAKNSAGGLIGEFPGLAVLDEDDNLRHTTDFRALYCSIFEQWLGVDADGLIPGASGFGRYALLS